MSTHCLLIIGQPAQDWAAKLDAIVGDDVEIGAARLPSAGIRQFESTPPDLLIIADSEGGSRVEILARALRKRPLGQLVPLFLLCPRPGDGSAQNVIDELDVVQWLPVDTGADALITHIESTLGDDLRRKANPAEDVTTASAPIEKEDGTVSYLDGEVVLEPVDEPAHHRVERSTIFRSTEAGDADGQSVSVDEIKRKLKAARHEDYYVILEVRRGAEGQTIREAFHRLAARFDPESLDFRLVRQLQDELDEIRDALEDAFAVLGDPQLRQSYLQHTV